MTHPSFSALLSAARAGDADAFAVLWREIHPPLLRYLQVLARDAAEDIASETWLQVIRGLDRFRGDEAGFRGWVFTVARSKVVDWRRYEGRRPAQPYAEPPVVTLLGDVADDVIDYLGTQAALKLIAQLPPDQAEIVALRVIAGLDVDDVARIVGKRSGTVRVACHRGLRRLHDLISVCNTELERDVSPGEGREFAPSQERSSTVTP